MPFSSAFDPGHIKLPGHGPYVYQVTIGISLRSQFKLSKLITRVFSQNEYASYGRFIDIPRLNLPGARYGNKWVVNKVRTTFTAYFGITTLALYASAPNHVLGQ